jgi:sec-independent protein translocase protein TatA
MGFGSPLHWIVLVLVIVLLFGGGRISSLMGDVAKGIKSFKKGLSDDDDDEVAARKAAPSQIEGSAERVSQPAATNTTADHKQG